MPDTKTTEHTQHVEECARAAYQTWVDRLAVGGKPWEKLSDTSKDDYRAEAAAVIRTYRTLTTGAAR